MKKSLPTSRLGRISRLGSMLAHMAGGTVGAVATNFMSSEKAFRIHKKTATKLLEALSEMKGLPMKMGQILSYMDGVLPLEYEGIYREALAKLQIKANPLPWQLMRHELENALGGPLGKVFSTFDETPLAAASIGQVYQGCLLDGRSVAVKVQYPGVADALTSDIKNVETVIKAVKAAIPGLDAGKMADDLMARLVEETDYELEASNQMLFRKLWADDPRIIIPEVITAYTRPNLLISTLHYGDSLEQIAKTKLKEERSSIGETLFWFAFRSILQHGLFNADPHPGNYLFPGEDRVVFLDFGCVQKYDEESRLVLRSLLNAMLAAGTGHDLWPEISTALGIEGDVPTNIRHLITEYIEFCFYPALAKQPFKFTKRYTQKVAELTMKSKVEVAKNIFRGGWREPKREGTVHFSRIIFGLFSILAELRAERDWRNLVQKEGHKRSDLPPELHKISQ